LKTCKPSIAKSTERNSEEKLEVVKDVEIRNKSLICLLLRKVWEKRDERTGWEDWDIR